LAKNLRLVVRLDSKTLPRIQAPAQTLLKLTQNGFDHYKPPIAFLFSFQSKAKPKGAINVSGAAAPHQASLTTKWRRSPMWHSARTRRKLLR
jgi:hypothetical protein